MTDPAGRLAMLREYFAREGAKRPKVDHNGYGPTNRHAATIAYTAPETNPAPMAETQQLNQLAGLQSGSVIEPPPPTLQDKLAAAVAAGDVLTVMRLNTELLIEQHAKMNGANNR